MSSEVITLNDLKEILSGMSPLSLPRVQGGFTGEIKMYAGTDEPIGWLKCDGRAISRTDYADLFAVIGTTYGSGDGSTTFNIPDLKGRFPLGVGAVSPGDSASEAYWGGTTAGSVNCSLGERAGEAWDTLDTSKIPSHRHFIIANGAPVSGNPTANHAINYYATSGYTDLPYSLRGSASAEPTVGKSSAVGGGGAHNNMPPFTALNYIICAI